MNQHQKYLREEKAQYDKQQCVFENGKIVENNKPYAIKSFSMKSDQIVLCPFCLMPNKIYDFFINFKNKFMAKCPNCKNLVQFRTLINMLKWTPQDLADFVFPYAKQGFWNKVYPDFKQWNKKLSQMNMSEDFWDRYKALRGNPDDFEEE